MKSYGWILVIALALMIFLVGGIDGFASDKDLPTTKGKKIVATVNDEPITLKEYNQEMEALREVTDNKKPDKKNFLQ